MSDLNKKHYKPTLRFNIKEKELLDNKARELGISTPKYIRLITRASLNNINIIGNLKPIDIQIRRIGANINQIAKHLNSHKSIDPSINKNFENLIKELESIKKKINELSLDNNK